MWTAIGFIGVFCAIAVAVSDYARFKYRKKDD